MNNQLKENDHKYALIEHVYIENWKRSTGVDANQFLMKTVTSVTLVGALVFTGVCLGTARKMRIGSNLIS